MKIIARVILNNEEREFDIACGNGDRSFKWLASAGMQRWAQAIPNGNLRRCDLQHGMTDNVQYSTTNVLLPSGEIPHPEAKLREFLRYGDAVTINLTGHQRVDVISGVPKRSAWSSVAFTKNASIDDVDLDVSDEEEDEDAPKYDDNGEMIKPPDNAAQRKAKVGYNSTFSSARLIVCEPVTNKLPLSIVKAFRKIYLRPILNKPNHIDLHFKQGSNSSQTS